MQLNGTLYKHKMHRDIALLPLKITHLANGLYVRGKYFNIHSERVNGKAELIHSYTEELFIKTEDLKNWEIYEMVQGNRTD